MVKTIRWKLSQIVDMAIIMLLDKFDFVVAISGNRGTGKSTFALHLARGLSRQFTKLKRFDKKTVDKYYRLVNDVTPQTYESFVARIHKLKLERKYKFKLKRDTLYRRGKAIEFYNDWNRIGISDEMVTTAFNRDFYNEEQKNFIKIINTNRDHSHAFLYCIPNFQVIDNQIKNLTKMHISVIKRGVALVHTPNKTIYGGDIWDFQYNGRIERKWLEKKIKTPQYVKLTTMRGVVRFPDLSQSVRDEYEAHKTVERNIIAKEDYDIEDDKDKDPIDNFVQILYEKGVRNSYEVEGFAKGIGSDIKKMSSLLRTRLMKRKLSGKLSDYYWDNGYKGVMIVEKKQELPVKA